MRAARGRGLCVRIERGEVGRMWARRSRDACDQARRGEVGHKATRRGLDVGGRITRDVAGVRAGRPSGATWRRARITRGGVSTPGRGLDAVARVARITRIVPSGGCNQIKKGMAWGMNNRKRATRNENTRRKRNLLHGIKRAK